MIAMFMMLVIMSECFSLRVDFRVANMLMPQNPSSKWLAIYVRLVTCGHIYLDGSGNVNAIMLPISPIHAK